MATEAAAEFDEIVGRIQVGIVDEQAAFEPRAGGFTTARRNAQSDVGGESTISLRAFHFEVKTYPAKGRVANAVVFLHRYRIILAIEGRPGVADPAIKTGKPKDPTRAQIAPEKFAFQRLAQILRRSIEEKREYGAAIWQGQRHRCTRPALAPQPRLAVNR
ncbi:MAG: hypothetical protein ACJ8AW_36880 [Rhodopila sp.]